LLARDFEVVRVRDLGEDRARVEVSQAEVARLRELKETVSERLKSFGFKDVVIDEKGYRRGALNEVIPISVKSSPRC
jgi:PP-loop superfamily ATP-utilizing enzyme